MIKEAIKWLVALLALLLIGLAALLGPSFIRLRRGGIADDVPPAGNAPAATDVAQCPGAPFIIPTEGWIGVLYGDSALGTVNHTGLDIFGPDGNGVTPVYAAYDGYLTRLPGWTSAVIIRHPRDPLNPDRQIWTYYTHMANTDGQSYIAAGFPPGAVEQPVKQGTRLGYQGDYNGGSQQPVATHLHFSIVRDDGQGNFLNETDLANTLDPSPYLGMRLNAACGDRPPFCRPDFYCP